MQPYEGGLHILHVCLLEWSLGTLQQRLWRPHRFKQTNGWPPTQYMYFSLKISLKKTVHWVMFMLRHLKKWKHDWYQWKEDINLGLHTSQLFKTKQNQTGLRHGSPYQVRRCGADLIMNVKKDMVSLPALGGISRKHQWSHMCNIITWPLYLQ